MIAQKILDNWLYWIVIDATSIYLYTSKGLYFTVFLFAIYIALSIYGYYNWRKKMHSSAAIA